jgi:lysine 6-dehydrogenase
MNVIIMKSYLVIGAGLQGEAIAYDLIKFDLDSNVLVVDNDWKKLNYIKKKIPSDRLQIVLGDASNRTDMEMLMDEMDVAIGATSPKLNALLLEYAINTKTNFCDLGINTEVLNEQFAMNERAIRAEITGIPYCGIAPGTDGIVLIKGFERIKNPTYGHIMVGGLPQNPKGPLKYMKVFKIESLISEYVEPAEIVENYKLKIIEPLGGIETIVFKDKRLPDGQVLLEAAYTSGGLSTLGRTYEGKIETLDYKTLRYPGHWEVITARKNGGEFRDEEFINGKSRRQISEELLEKEIGYEDKDLLFMMVRVGNDKMEAKFQLIDFYNDITGHTAMQRTTGYSAAIVAEMLAYGMIKDKGILKIEESIDPDVFLPELSRRGINLEYTLINK